MKHEDLEGHTEQCSRKTVLSIKVSLSIKRDRRLQRILCASAIRVDLRSRGQAIEREYKVASCRDGEGQSKYYEVLQREAGRRVSARPI